MKILFYLLLLSTFFTAQAAKAHGDHGDHDFQEHFFVSENVAIIIAQRATTTMTRKDAGLGFGQLPESWAEVPKEDFLIYKKGSGYYIVSVNNKNEDTILYVLMSLAGQVYDANMVGLFDGIN